MCYSIALDTSKEPLALKKNSSFLTLEEYMKGSIPLMVPVNIIKSWILRDKVSYLAQQSFFTPFPSGLPGTWIQQSENESISNSFTLS